MSRLHDIKTGTQKKHSVEMMTEIMGKKITYGGFPKNQKKGANK